MLSTSTLYGLGFVDDVHARNNNNIVIALSIYIGRLQNLATPYYD